MFAPLLTFVPGELVLRMGLAPPVAGIICGRLHGCGQQHLQVLAVLLCCFVLQALERQHFWVTCLALGAQRGEKGGRTFQQVKVERSDTMETLSHGRMQFYCTEGAIVNGRKSFSLLGRGLEGVRLFFFFLPDKCTVTG